MPTRRIQDTHDKQHCKLYRLMQCTHPDHEPPGAYVFEPGIYEHECPSCHRKTVFVVRQQTMDILPYVPHRRHNEVICNIDEAQCVTFS